MWKALDYLFFALTRFVGPLGLLAILAFLLGYYFLFRRRDYQTALEITCIAWLTTICRVSVAIYHSFSIEGYNPIPKWWEMQINQYEPFASILVIPVLLTLPIAWSCLQPNPSRSLARSRLLILAVLIAFLDVLLYMAVFVPLWEFTGP